MLLDIRHETVYRYAVPASYSVQVMRLWPSNDAGQRVIDWSLEAPGRRWSQVDGFGNRITVSSLVERHSEIRVVAQGRVQTLGEPGMLREHDLPVPPLVFAVPTRLTATAPAVEALASRHLGDAQGLQQATPEGLRALMAEVHACVAYVKGVTDVQATAAQVLDQRQGASQDMAHVFLACCRARGIPARYVSGYLLSRNEAPPPGSSTPSGGGPGHGPALGALGDAQPAASHAWVEVWLPNARSGAGAWFGLDVTHDRLAGPELCRLAVGRDHSEASPIRGIHVGGAGEELGVRVSVSGAADAAQE